MSEKLPSTNPDEEVDLGVLFNAIGKFFDKIFGFISNVFKSLFSLIIYAIKPLISNFKVIFSIMILAGILGFFLEKQSQTAYKSVMLVKPYFDSKYQLVNNIDYFNALISNGDYETLTEIFNITEEDAKTINGFEIETGPESENDKIKLYDEYLKTFDSIRAQEISYENFIQNRDIFSSDFFKISVNSQNKNIFKNLENGLNASFKNTYSEKQKQKRDSLLYLQKQSILASLRSVDSLGKVYVKVLEEGSKSNSAISLGEVLSVQPEKSRTREYDLLNKELELRNRLRLLEEVNIEENDFFDIVSGFQSTGIVSKSIYQKYVILFPLYALALLSLVFLTKKTIRFVENYE